LTALIGWKVPDGVSWPVDTLPHKVLTPGAGKTTSVVGTGAKNIAATITNTGQMHEDKYPNCSKMRFSHQVGQLDGIY
jgi:hypothetical protein